MLCRRVLIFLSCEASTVKLFLLRHLSARPSRFRRGFVGFFFVYARQLLSQWSCRQRFYATCTNSELGKRSEHEREKTKRENKLMRNMFVACRLSRTQALLASPQVDVDVDHDGSGDDDDDDDGDISRSGMSLGENRSNHHRLSRRAVSSPFSRRRERCATLRLRDNSG